MRVSIGAYILKRAAILGLAFLSVAAGAANKPPQHFVPAGPWAMEYADEGCRLIRKFSDGKTDITLALERFSLKPSLRLGLTGEGLKMSRVSQIEFRWGEEKLRTSDYLSVALADGRSAYLFPSASLNEPETPATPYKPWPSPPPPGKPVSELLKAEKDIANRVSTVVIATGFPAPISLELGRMAGPIEAIQKCADDLVASWGVDTEHFLKQSRPVTPKNDPLGWFSADDYPPSQLSRNGVVPYRLVIGPDGRIEKCMVGVAKRGPFEQAVCDAMTARAKFAPALDSEGNPFRSYFESTVRFRTW